MVFSTSVFSISQNINVEKFWNVIKSGYFLMIEVSMGMQDILKFLMWN